MNKKRRDHISEVIFYLNRTIRGFIFPILTLFLSLIGETNKFTPYIKGTLYIIIPGIVLYSILSWFLKTYTFKETYITVSEGVISRRNDRIPYKNIKSIDTSSNIVNQMMRVKMLSVELIGGEEFSFTVREAEVSSLEQLLLEKLKANSAPQSIPDSDQIDSNINLSNLEKEKKNLIKAYVPDRKFTFIQFVCISLGNPKIFFSSLSITAVLFSTLNGLWGKFSGTVEPSVSFIETGKSLVSLIKEDVMPFVFVFLIFSVASYLVSFVHIFLTYGRFKISSNDESLSVSYGILSKKDHLIPRSGIRSVRIREPFAYRVFGYVQVSVDNIRQSSKNIIINPIIKKTGANHFIAEHLSEFEMIEADHQPERASIFAFIMKPVSIFLSLLFILAYLYKPLIWLSPLLIFAVFNGFLHWRYSGISFRANFNLIRKVRFFNVETLVSKQYFIQSTSLLSIADRMSHLCGVLSH